MVQEVVIQAAPASNLPAYLIAAIGLVLVVVAIWHYESVRRSRD
jgi:hypothetical protein